MISFQSTLPRRERQNHPHNIHRIKYNFNPRSREGSDTAGRSIRSRWTHFNPRSREGSDILARADRLYFHISIHAPAKGATSCRRCTLNGKHYFNPRSREGSDSNPNWSFTSPRNFNPRSREGSDNREAMIMMEYFKFQSTLPRRERQHLLTSFRLQYGYSLFHLTNKI